jgi:hypothetical protein
MSEVGSLLGGHGLPKRTRAAAAAQQPAAAYTRQLWFW